MWTEKELRSSVPYVPPKNPFQTFLLLLSMLAAFPLLSGQEGSAVMDEALDDRTVFMWGVALFFGSMLALLGLWFPKKYRIPGLLLERSGLILVGGAAAIYATIVLLSVPAASEVRYAMSVQTAYSVACFWRCYQITNIIRWATSAAAMRGGSRG